MGKYYEIRRLSKLFFEDYPSERYPELLCKENRPYMVLLVKINDLVFALPFRSNIKHSYSYIFKNSSRNNQSHSGIDFNKAVLITNLGYIGEKCSIDSKEFLELEKKFFFVISKFKRYLNGFYKVLFNKTSPSFQRRYRYSTLNYFKKEMSKNTKI